MSSKEMSRKGNLSIFVLFDCLQVYSSVYLGGSWIDRSLESQAGAGTKIRGKMRPLISAVGICSVTTVPGDQLLCCNFTILPLTPQTLSNPVPWVISSRFKVLTEESVWPWLVIDLHSSCQREGKGNSCPPLASGVDCLPLYLQTYSTSETWSLKHKPN